MANIDLNKLYKKNFVTTSKVDTDIGIDRPVITPEYYSDLKLDLQLLSFKNKFFNAGASDNDLSKVTNEEAVITSLRNIMNSTYCSRLLNPELDFDMRSYLFENLTEAKAFFIGYDLYHMIPAYEPRVIINDIKVVANIMQDTYSISLSISIPSLQKDVTLSSILSEEGFLFG